MSFCIRVRIYFSFGGVRSRISLFGGDARTAKLRPLPRRFKIILNEENFKPSELHDMATHLGKRKRSAADSQKNPRRSESEESGSSNLDAEEIFRRHFEAQFKPLPVVQKLAKQEEDESEDEPSEESEWDGISEPVEERVEIVEHSDTQSRIAAMSKEERKAFMVCSFPAEIALC